VLGVAEAAVTVPDPAGVTAALERLDAELDRNDFATTLTTGDNRPSRLTVRSRHAQIEDDIYADSEWYWWSWAERIAPVDEPAAAAQKIAAVLHAGPEPTDG
jgi:hypothetical protein